MTECSKWLRPRVENTMQIFHVGNMKPLLEPSPLRPWDPCWELELRREPRHADTACRCLACLVVCVCDCCPLLSALLPHVPEGNLYSDTWVWKNLLAPLASASPVFFPLEGKWLEHSRQGWEWALMSLSMWSNQEIWFGNFKESCPLMDNLKDRGLSQLLHFCYAFPCHLPRSPPPTPLDNMCWESLLLGKIQILQNCRKAKSDSEKSNSVSFVQPFDSCEAMSSFSLFCTLIFTKFVPETNFLLS